MEQVAKYPLGEMVYTISIPSEKNVICENAYYDRNYDEQGNCKYDCYRHCKLPQAKITRMTVKSVHIDMDLSGDWKKPNVEVKATYNGKYPEDMLFGSYDEAKEVLLEEIKRQKTYWMGGGTPLLTLGLTEELYDKLMKMHIVTVEAARKHFTDRQVTDILSFEEITELGDALR